MWRPLQTMRILVSPSGFKSLEPDAAADCIEEGILRVLPTAIIRKAPLVDGGEGFTRGLVAATHGRVESFTVTGPVGKPVDSFYGFTGSSRKNAVIEMAAAAGLRLVPRDARDPGLTTTYGVGELLAKVLDEGATHVLVGCGDSGTCDGGAGMLQALGGRLLDVDGNELPKAGGGRDLAKIANIDVSGLHPRLKEAKIKVACNWENKLCGENGVARVFGPQMGATEQQVEELASALDTYASVAKDKLGLDVSSAGGSGASGGLGAGLMIIGATLHPRFDLIMKYINLDILMEDCDLIITAEGGIDKQTPRGKVPAEVAMYAKKRNLPVLALAGKIGMGAGANYSAGIDAYASILQKPSSLEEAMEDVERLLQNSAESAMRMIMIGLKIDADRRRWK